MVFYLALRTARRQLIPTKWTSNLEHTTQPLRFLHATSVVPNSEKRQFFSRNAALQQDVKSALSDKSEGSIKSLKRKTVRSSASNRSLRRVAVEAERSRENALKKRDVSIDTGLDSNGITAICVAEEFDMDVVVKILRSHGYPIDPYGTGFLDEQVVHTLGTDKEDIFIFPSGTLVSWSLSENLAKALATEVLVPAAINSHASHIEMEDLDFTEDPNRESSNIKGDIITIGAKQESSEQDTSIGMVDKTLVKIAFSSGLARSTKLAVLETMLSKYFESTRSIPTLLSKGSRLPFRRSFILQKTGELLSLRAQLNHYSELTDSLPDLFWDSRHDLGLEGYYDQVGKALDIGVRIRALNQKMDYAQEIAGVLRETLSEKHSTWLEWIIIVLIAVEVGFELRRLWKEKQDRLAEEAAAVKLLGA